MILDSDKKQLLVQALDVPCRMLACFGLLMAVGYALCPQSMQGGPLTGPVSWIGLVLVRIGGAVTDNAGFLFAASAAAACSRTNKAEAALLGVGAFLILSALSSSFLVTALKPELAEAAEALVYLPSPLTGLMCGKLAAAFRQKKQSGSSVQSILQFALAAALCSAVLVVLWMGVFTAVTKLGKLLGDGRLSSAALFAILNRMLMPFHLHHGLNRPVLFQEGSGDLVRYWANQTAGDPGRYMSGFFAPMMFGLPAIAVFLWRKAEVSETGRQLLLPAAVCSFLIGFSEPLEFLLFFTEPLLYGLYCMLYGVFALLAGWTGFRAGFALSGGLCDLIFSAACPAASRTWLILPLGAAAAGLYYGLCAAVWSWKNHRSEKKSEPAGSRTR